MSGSGLIQARRHDVASRLTGPAARIVLAVAQQALLTPLGIERLIIGVRQPSGRFTIVTTDASNRPERDRASFEWSEAAPIVSSLREQSAGGTGTVRGFGERFLYRYATSVPDSSDEIVVGAVLDREPDRQDLLHAAVSSSVYTLLPQSASDIPDASVSVSVDPVGSGFAATVVCVVGEGVRSATVVDASAVRATALATSEASGNGLNIRFADQVVVEGKTVSLVVADSILSVPIVGASQLPSGEVAPALAVLAASNAVRRVEAERQESVSNTAPMPVAVSAS